VIANGAALNLRDIYPGMTCTYFYIGGRWVETSRKCFAEVGAASYKCVCSRAGVNDC
jgi:hypothetical protein